MIPKNQKTATSTNQQARITSKHELTSVQSSCIPTNQHHEPRTRIPASTYQGHGYQQAPSSSQHQPAPSRHVSPASTNSPAFKAAAYLPTSTTNQGHGYQQAPTKDTDTSKHQAAITYQGHEPTSNQHEPAGTYHQQARTHQRSK